MVLAYSGNKLITRYKISSRNGHHAEFLWAKYFNFHFDNYCRSRGKAPILPYDRVVIIVSQCCCDNSCVFKLLSIVARLQFANPAMKIDFRFPYCWEYKKTHRKPKTQDGKRIDSSFVAVLLLWYYCKIAENQTFGQNRTDSEASSLITIEALSQDEMRNYLNFDAEEVKKWQEKGHHLIDNEKFKLIVDLAKQSVPFYEIFVDEYQNEISKFSMDKLRQNSNIKLPSKVQNLLLEFAGIIYDRYKSSAELIVNDFELMKFNLLMSVQSLESNNYKPNPECLLLKTED